MKTKEEIYLKIYKESPSLMNFYDYKTVAIEAMEEYGKQCYNQAIDDIIENVKTTPIMIQNCDDHTPYWGPSSTCGRYDNPEVKIGDNIDKESILKLKKK